jgi:hypothetical protein
MTSNCSNCDRTIAVEESRKVLCAECWDTLVASQGPALAGDPPEFDHRGVQLPARTRVGGIITPQ